MNKLYNIYKDAPPLGKILLIAAVILLAYLIYKGVKKLLAPGPTNEGQQKSASDELKDLAQAGEVSHYTESQMKGFADKLFKAMDGQGTDEEQIKAVFKYMQNKADVLELIRAFGVRTYEDGLFVSYEYNLTEWLNEELSQDELDKFVNDPLRSAGINYSF